MRSAVWTSILCDCCFICVYEPNDLSNIGEFSTEKLAKNSSFFTKVHCSLSIEPTLEIRVIQRVLNFWQNFEFSHLIWDILIEEWLRLKLNLVAYLDQDYHNKASIVSQNGMSNTIRLATQLIYFDLGKHSRVNSVILAWCILIQIRSLFTQKIDTLLRVVDSIILSHTNVVLCWCYSE